MRFSADPILSKLFAIKPNILEAQAITGCVNVEEAACCLLEMGVKQVYLSMGAKGLYYTDGRDSGILPPVKFPAHCSFTGAGDAMTAGISAGIARGMSIKETAEYASLTCENHIRGNNNK